MQPRYRIPNSNGASTSAPTFWNLLNRNGEEEIFFFLVSTQCFSVTYKTLISVILYWNYSQLEKILLTHFPQNFVYLCIFYYIITLRLRSFHYNWTEFSWPISFRTWEFWKLFCCFKTYTVLLSVSTVKLLTICIFCCYCLLLFSIRRTLETALSKKV